MTGVRPADQEGCVFLSPAEIKQQQLREKRGAYEREDVDGLLDNVVGSYQHVWLERDRLKARVEELEKEMANTKELEQLLRDGLASAQRAAEQVKEEAEQQVSGLVDKAKEEAEALLADARAKAEEIVGGSRDTRDRLEEETTRLERANHDVRERYMAFLREALAVVEGTAEQKAVTPQDAAVAEADESAPVAEEAEELEAPVGWLAPVPLMAVASDEVAESIERPEPEAAEPEAAEPEAEAEPEPEPEPVAEADEEEEDVPATVLLSAVAPLEEEAAPEEPEPAAEAAEEDATTDEHALGPLRVAESEAEAEPEPEPEPEAEAEPEPEKPEDAEPPAEAEAPPEEEALGDEAYMTFRAVPAIRVAEPESADDEPEADEGPGEDTYEDWSPKKG
jgi:cell division septum initiation protein DivIVA